MRKKELYSNKNRGNQFEGYWCYLSTNNLWLKSKKESLFTSSKIKIETEDIHTRITWKAWNGTVLFFNYCILLLIKNGIRDPSGKWTFQELSFTVVPHLSYFKSGNDLCTKFYLCITYISLYLHTTRVVFKKTQVFSQTSNFYKLLDLYARKVCYIEIPLY